ncbi:MAG: hypothetical protein Q9225_005378 [Loekoesia sp. 1 TL-2023]
MLDICDPEFVRAARYAAIQVRDKGDYERAERMLLNLGAAQEKVYGKEHVESLRIVFELAFVQCKRDRYEDAECLFCQLLSIRRRVLGPEHPHSVNTMVALTDVYRLQGRLVEAGTLMEEVFTLIRADTTTSKHRYCNILNNLALVYQEQGRLEKARNLFEQSLYDGEDELEPDDLDHLNVMDNLARIYDELGQNANAEDLYKRAFTLRVRAWGSEHPDTLESMIKFANFLEYQSRWNEASILHQKVLNAKEARLGSDQLETYFTRCRAARPLFRGKQFAEAAVLLEKVMSAKTLFFGDEDTSTQLTFLHAQYGLAVCYHGQQRYAEAAKHYALSLKGIEDRIGKDHYSLSSILYSFGRLHCDENRHVEAQKLFERCLKIIERNLISGEADDSRVGDRETSTMKDEIFNNLYPKCVEELADTFESLDQLERAEATLQDSLAFAQEHYGSSSPVPVSIAVHLAIFCGNHDRFQEEIDLMLPALEFRQSHYGQTHHSTIYPLRGLASANYILGRKEEAVPYYQQAISAMEKEWGAQDLGTKDFVKLYLNVLLSIGGVELVEKKGIVDEWAEKGVNFYLVRDEKEDEDDAHDGSGTDTPSERGCPPSSQDGKIGQRATDQTSGHASRSNHHSQFKL